VIAPARAPAKWSNRQDWADPRNRQEAETRQDNAKTTSSRAKRRAGLAAQLDPLVDLAIVGLRGGLHEEPDLVTAIPSLDQGVDRGLSGCARSENSDVVIGGMAAGLTHETSG
jgi:hypothetical protein